MSLMTNKSSKSTGLIWERLPDSAAESTTLLSHAQIVQAAMTLADAEGAEGISMRRIATQLNSSAMSLYRYVTSKDDLLDLMLDEVFSEIHVPKQPSEAWRDEYRELAYKTRAVFKAHPWVIPLLNSRPTIGPHYMRWFEFSLAVVGQFGLEISTTTQIASVLLAYVLGVVGYELAEEENNRRTGITEESKRAYANTSSYLQRLIASGQYPYSTRFFTENIVVDPDQGFEFGLTCLLEGFAAHITSR